MTVSEQSMRKHHHHLPFWNIVCVSMSHATIVERSIERINTFCIHINRISSTNHGIHWMKTVSLIDVIENSRFTCAFEWVVRERLSALVINDFPKLIFDSMSHIEINLYYTNVHKTESFTIWLPYTERKSPLIRITLSIRCFKRKQWLQLFCAYM